MGNSATGSYQTTDQAVMRAFDSLPAAAREALRNSIENWVPQPLAARWRKGQSTPTELVSFVVNWDKKEMAAREDQRRRAIGPYKGNQRDPDYTSSKTRPKAPRRNI
jgi:hypothetical protein